VRLQLTAGARERVRERKHGGDGGLLREVRQPLSAGPAADRADHRVRTAADGVRAIAQLANGVLDAGHVGVGCVRPELDDHGECPPG
jgi:hypothetical protein